MIRWSAVLLIAFSVACSGDNNEPQNEPDSGGQTQADTGSVEQDGGSVGDDAGSSQTDTGSSTPDVGTTTEDMASGVTFGEVCETIEATEELECDVPEQTGCPDDAACQVLFVPSEMRPRPACNNIDPTATLSNGDACVNGMADERCPQSSNCYGGVCVAICRLSDGAGCQPDEFCKLVDPNLEPFGLGVCLDSCD